MKHFPLCVFFHFNLSALLCVFFITAQKGLDMVDQIWQHYFDGNNQSKYDTGSHCYSVVDIVSHNDIIGIQKGVDLE